jgi:hypothetical protein
MDAHLCQSTIILLFYMEFLLWIWISGEKIGVLFEGNPPTLQVNVIEIIKFQFGPTPGRSCSHFFARKLFGS